MPFEQRPNIQGGADPNILDAFSNAGLIKDRGLRMLGFNTAAQIYRVIMTDLGVDSDSLERNLESIGKAPRETQLHFINNVREIYRDHGYQTKPETQTPPESGTLFSASTGSVGEVSIPETSFDIASG